MIKTKLAIATGLLMGMASLQSLSFAEVDCGMAGDEGSIPGNNFAGYWRTTYGTMRLVRIGNMLEGPSTASGYLKGSEAANTFQGRFAEDTGRYHAGRFEITMFENGRCLKGRMVYDDPETDPGDIIGYRMKRPSDPYRSYYELTNRTEHLKQMVGGVLSFDQIDGPDNLAGPASAPPQFAPSLPTIGSHQDEEDTDTPEQEENETAE